MKSALYAGRVVHVRPGKHRLQYALFMLALDLDEIDMLDARLKRFSHNRLNLFSFHDRDHAGRIDKPVKPQIEAKLAGAGIGWGGGEITLLALPRILNCAFNPICVYFCHRRDGTLAALVHEVANTFGERHFYVLAARANADGVVEQDCAKTFFVSPFLEMDLRYEFCVEPPGKAVKLVIVARRGREIALAASFTGARRNLTDTALMSAFFANPLLGCKVMAAIHWEAVKMLAKGVRYLGRKGGLSPGVLSGGALSAGRSSAPQTTTSPGSR